MLGLCIVLLITEFMYAEDEFDEYQDISEELYVDIKTKNNILQTILKESEKKVLSNEDIKDIINPNTILL